MQRARNGDPLQGPKVRPLTAEERNAIRTLRNLAKRWPESLWLYSASGVLCVMQCGEDGRRAYTQDTYNGTDPDYIVERIDIPNDGGDW